MNPLRSVGGRLSLALLLVVTGAFGIAYLVVVPRLENRLVDARLGDLASNAETVTDQAFIREDDTRFPDEVNWGEFAVAMNRALNVRVAVLQRTPGGFGVLADSGLDPGELRKDALALRFAASGENQRGVVTRNGERGGQVVFSGPGNANPALFFLATTSLEDTFATVSLVERRLLLAGLIALAVALAVGFAAARMFARRVRRLERAADRIAAGHFDQPVVDHGRDELGQLAATFDRMRQRLAHLEHARREFIANASHELRTPLFALAGLLELLDDEDLDEPTRREFLTTAREQSDRLTRLATGLLDLSRLDAGRMHLERETVELDAVAEVLADEFRAIAHGNDHPLEVLGASASAVADELRVLQIGRVLVENALLHTPAGTPLRVRTRAREGRAMLSVEDDGQGIPPEHADHVFERFYRVNGAVTSGSGLGLAIARELAELMGGELEFESRPGRTVFTLSLPAAALPQRAAVI